MHRNCVKIGFEMMIIHILYQDPEFNFDKKSFEMVFGDIHEHNIKQTCLGHTDIVFLLSLYFFATTGFEVMFVKGGGLAREKRAERSTMDTWITKSGYLCIQEILVVTKSSVRLTYRTYIHYTSTLLTWITKKELEQEIKKQRRPISLRIL